MADLDSGGAWSNRKLWGIVLLALAIRLGWGMSRPVNDAGIDALPDQRDYLSLAQNVIQGKGLGFIDKRFGDWVRAFRTPGYPAFLVACGANVRAARAVQAAVDTSTVLAVFYLARLAVSHKRRDSIGLVAAGIVAVNPYLIYFSGLLLSETLFTANLIWGMVLLIYGGSGERASRRAMLAWWAGGFLLSFSILVRPSAIGLPVGLGWAVMLLNRRGSGTYQGIREPETGVKPGPAVPAGAAMVGLMLLVLTPWAWRNFRELGAWVWLDTNSGFTLYDGYNPDATGASDQSFVSREPELQVLGELDRSEYLKDKAWQYARGHPKRCVELALAKLGRMWSPLTLSSEYGHTRYRLIALAYSIPLDVLVVAGLMSRSVPRASKFVLLSPALYFSIVHALSVGSLRYRIPAEPPMAVLAAAFIIGGLGFGETWRRSGDAEGR